MTMTAEEKEITLFQDRYMSSEEDLSPIEVNLDDTLSVNDEVADYVTARPVTIGPSKPKKSGDLAVVVSMAPTPIDLSSLHKIHLNRVGNPKLDFINHESRQLTPLLFANIYPQTLKLPLQILPSLDSADIRLSNTPSFLSSDPFPSIHEADPAAKPSHSRLRSLSRVFSTARMAVSSSKKGTDNRNSTPNPSRPSTPTAPALPPRRPSMTRPQTAGAGARASVMLPLTTPADNASEWDKPRSKPKMVARGAAERAPTIELPPFPDEEDDKEVEFKRRRLGRRKSFLGLI
ncbi:hypothetical protein H2199_006087 [Coniosporium tulheliwenetii]|uniref:Uncharacterized protein n=1 Tax=Coniosporium tulheliwenetii TaxID=3383036 RepID=A0ACC2YWS8_9PEZI|nr:hypothetical protein H2199_006087 [Cladosporium sp. JES 115]